MKYSGLESKDILSNICKIKSNNFQDMSTQTIPPPTATFNANVLQWTIFDEYQVQFSLHNKLFYIN